MFSFLDIFFIKKELASLINKRFEKLFVGENFVLFQFSGEIKLFLKVVFGKAIFLANKELSKDSFIQKPQFFKELEEYLNRSFLKDIKIFPGERILDLIFKFGEEEKKIRIALFGKGEIVFNNKFRIGLDLEIKKNFELNKESLEKELKNFEGNVEKFINNYLGLGKHYGNELKERLKFRGFCFFNKDTKDLDESEKEELFKELFNLINQKFEPYLSEKRPFPIKLITQKVVKEFESFSNALDYFFRPKTKFEMKLEQLEGALKKQEEKIQKLKKEAEELRKIGDKFFEYYEFFSDLKEYLEKNKKNLNQIKQKLKEKGIELDIKEQHIEFDLELLEKLKSKE
jgi:predicted ribosome quality control (RQC) complex YloA/Tae2 family protein